MAVQISNMYISLTLVDGYDTLRGHQKKYTMIKTLIKFDCKSNEHFRRISSVRPHRGSTSMFPWYSWTASWCHHSCYHLVLQPCGQAWTQSSLGRQRIQWRRDRPLSSEIQKAWTGERSLLAWPAANCFLEIKVIKHTCVEKISHRDWIQKFQFDWLFYCLTNHFYKIYWQITYV